LQLQVARLKKQIKMFFMKSYHDLEIYKESKSLAIEVHKMTLQL